MDAISREMFSILTWEQIEELRDNIAATVVHVESAEMLVAAVESTSPKLAADLRQRSPQEIVAIGNLLFAFITMMFQIYAVLHPVTPTQVTQIINIVNNVQETTNVLPPPAAGGEQGSPTQP
ncbi:MAG TPA: hypothetical protein VKI00_24750 [Mycobacterium sp.]|uniref:hypothetical protein n=1 Tax=Mycobacterium sp. TaxID=1785 RepID=UPI002C8EAE47|nr:hypothetical protein [Mycobacterium sp.]HME78743.1 hypothetical protein [Mycobacterium sp.]